MTVHDMYPTRGSREPALLYRHDDPTVYGKPEDGMLTAEQLAHHEAAGYTDIEQLLNDAEVEKYAEEMDRLLQETQKSATSADQGDDEHVVREDERQEVLSIFDVHRNSELFAELISDERVAGVARQILGSEVYIHHSRISYKPGLVGTPFYWHSDFETWHAEDGMPRMRAVTLSLALTDNTEHNGSVMVMPGSHKVFVSCVGDTPDEHYKSALQDQRIGTPDDVSLGMLAEKYGIQQLNGPAGSATWIDCNLMRGTNGNITPFARANLVVAFNSVENECGEPYRADEARPDFLARDVEPI
ncbi:ectoine hydroxylase [Natronoglycomyces albus]|uniref:Ectoine hydroxylase n=1 Tax=Natronoglycomyces albus TaxID=2811108 RepID=A0A895XPV9_9ACTN|nr:ectoine hydroxylase [Natronoglycomyces albus]QSB04576.1 ectoine hydroxylase [Natronoglycomyces albus]